VGAIIYTKTMLSTLEDHIPHEKPLKREEEGKKIR
jgi:hypothetical protein